MQVKVPRIAGWCCLSVGFGLLCIEVVLSASSAVAVETDSLRRGKILFERNCAGCHGLTGKGDGY
jgi:mono/diheme cytochrome c family protein